MKYIKFVALSVILGLGLNSCTKLFTPTPEIENPNIVNPLKGEFKCTMDGSGFSATSKTFNLSEIDGVKSLTITGIKYDDNRTPGKYQQIIISIPVYENAKRYAVNAQASIVYLYVDGSSTTTYRSLDNTNYNVEVAGEYSGTFNAVLANVADPSQKVMISDGIFESE